MSATVRVMLVDDHAVLRTGLQRLLEQKSGVKVVAEAGNGEQAYQTFGTHSPDVAVMDLTMPGMGGLESLRRILARWPAARVVVFSMHDEAAFAAQALSAGARGYVAKSDEADELVQAVQEVAAGRSYISRGVAQKVALHTLVREDDLLARLSTREFEIFRLLAEGGSVEKIAEMLKISQKTVANHQTILKQKLNVSSPVELVRLAIRYGVIEG